MDVAAFNIRKKIKNKIMKWFQKEIILAPKKRGFHIITHEIVSEIPELTSFSVGVAHIFIKHTSASLTINESASPEVRDDMEAHFSRTVPENMSYYRHVFEGEDDMPAHIKASLLGNSLSVPITNGELNLGTWQGIYLGEHRNHPTRRRLIITLSGVGDAAPGR